MKSGAVELEKEVEMGNEEYLYKDWSENYNIQYTPDGTRLTVVFEYHGQNIMQELKKLKKRRGFSGKWNEQITFAEVGDGESVVKNKKV